MHLLGPFFLPKSVLLLCWYNTEEHPPPNKFLLIQEVPKPSFRPLFHAKEVAVRLQGPGHASAVPGGAFSGSSGDTLGDTGGG